ncbi:prepilin-type N-terminal cleavage/methylation domain-containing protein [Cellulomonas sp. McL0617]|uniref:prepilin-type N-terminal cleavage/methylation domain-containing protein n=1 Tax=Cellulomonas sp. McL0617 TaxID=3415675 RepID=UPI003CF8A1CC
MITTIRRRLGDRDRGTSLVEMLMTMIIFGIVIAATASLTIGFARTNGQSVSRQDQIDVARTTVETVSKKLRTAVMPSQLTSTCTLCTQDAFVVGKDYSVQFYANINNPGNTVGPSRVTYAITATGTGVGTLVEKVQTPDSNVPTSSGYVYCDAEASGATSLCKARLNTQTLARGVQTATGTPMFAYYDGAGTRLLPASGASLSATDLSHVLAIELTVTVQAQNTTRVRPTTYIQRLTLPNAQAILRQEDDGS